tara:strand:- start:923 stop:1213 length:291 start_codon:yes stop_codon:yes gene_type:complete
LYLKIHKSEFSEIIAVCDSNLLGKTLKQEDFELTISEDFYKGEEKTEQEVILILKNADNANLIGENAVSAGLSAGIISKENIIKIEGVPHAQAYAI